MGKAARNRAIRLSAFGSKKAARRIRKNHSTAHDVVPMVGIVKAAVEERLTRSGFVLPEGGIVIPELDAGAVLKEVQGANQS